MGEESLKVRTARAVKWNAVDRISSQILYGITGIVLARLLSPVDFGLAGAVYVFQAFASLLIDSGFSYALLQRKQPTRLDYSSVLWFNLAIATTIYLILFATAPLVAWCFGGDQRLIPISRVMFLTFILNASAIVQTNRLTKQMHVRPLAVANVIALIAGGVTGIWLALEGFGAWAIVWQSIAVAGVKSIVLWLSSHWLPLWQFSMASIRSFFSVGSGMMLTSLLNTIFSYINSFIIGNRVGLAPLGYYTQADKWSKMGVMSIQQTLTSSFLPALSDAQDDPQRLLRLCSKMNRMAAYLMMPCLIGLMLMAGPIFHLFFGEKWDLSIALFVLLLVRGIFTILSALYTNYLLAVGRTHRIVRLEVVRDVLSIVALAATIPWIGLSTAEDFILGVRVLLYGQVAAAAVAWVVTLVATCRELQASPGRFCMDLLPYFALMVMIAPVLYWIATSGLHPILILGLQIVTGAALYVGINAALGSKIQADAWLYIKGKMR